MAKATAAWERSVKEVKSLTEKHELSIKTVEEAKLKLLKMKSDLKARKDLLAEAKRVANNALKQWKENA